MCPKKGKVIALQVIPLLFIVCHFCQIAIAQNGLMAEYYDGKDFNNFVAAEYVSKIEATWYDEPPVPGINPYNCSIRYTGKLSPSKTATYAFAAQVDDGIRVWIDGEMIINQWNLNDVGVFSGKKDLIANEQYDIKVEYFNALREGEIRLLWDIEKTRAEKSWYETFFGVEHDYKVITAEYFIRPSRPLPTVIQKEALAVKPAPSPPAKAKKPLIKVKTNEAKTITRVSQPQPKSEPLTIEKAEKFIPKNIEFVRAKSELLTSSEKELDIFANFMTSHPQVTVMIEGHTDAVGVPAQNQFLSERRANKVARYLVQHGIAGRRIKTIGYGGSKPLKVPAEGEYYPPNRRVVFILSGLE